MEKRINLSSEFNGGLTVEEYTQLLNDQKPLHDLHYRKAEVEEYRLAKLPPLKVLVITEPWCGDSTAILPTILKLLEEHDVTFRIVLRDAQPDLMDKFLTKGVRAIPMILVLDQDANFLFRYGSRPESAQAIYEAHRKDIDAGRIKKMDVSKKIRTFYAKDRGHAILKEFTKRMNDQLFIT